MKEYIISILYIAIFTIVLELILPDSKLKKYVLGIVSLLAIITVISPVTNILKAESVESTIRNVTEVLSKNISTNNRDTPSYDFSKYTNTAITNSTKDKIEKSIKEEFKTESIDNVQAILNNDYTLEEIQIYIIPKDQLLGTSNVSKMIQKISDKFNISQEKIKIIER